MMIIPLTPEIETAPAEQARRNRMAPDEILGLAAQVYAGLSEQEVRDVDKIALDRSNFVGQRQSL